MSTITKERIANLLQFNSEGSDCQANAEQWEVHELARIALASLEEEPYGYVHKAAYEQAGSCGLSNDHEAYSDSLSHIAVYTAPPATVSMKDHQIRELVNELRDIAIEYQGTQQLRERIARTVRAAMLQGADTEIQRKAAIHDALCEKYNVESLADFVGWQRNHIAELEVAPPAPIGEGETAVMPDYPGYAMTQRECFEAGKNAGLAELVTTTYKLPDGWVACSERMPEDGGLYLCYVQDEYEFDISHFCFEYLAAHKKFNSAGINITHWMPLPAAPQQEVKS